ncbi:hypothetical protein RHGRI_020840 [Rhododendron griersonianum]|uniref:Uncharacterized protein n=1 Tax=Rhododendron griersonianum TaxID=479676 RepID=A0AAV6JLR6_9ERIC|nr:hypothetical protein RHGRI_020840 [Rhododendron griersonianum]
MANGTISLAEGLGLKALDSNELRRRQQVLDPSNSPHFLPSPMKVETQQGDNPGDSSSGFKIGNDVHASYSGGFEVSNPKSAKLSSPSRTMAEGLGGFFSEDLYTEASRLVAHWTSFGAEPELVGCGHGRRLWLAGLINGQPESHRSSRLISDFKICSSHRLGFSETQNRYDPEQPAAGLIYKTDSSHVAACSSFEFQFCGCLFSYCFDVKMVL